jgi:hypothetical protein
VGAAATNGLAAAGIGEPPEGTYPAIIRLPYKEASMAEKILSEDVVPRSCGDPLHPQVISANAARGGPLGGRLLVMMVAAIILCAAASAIIELLYWPRP